AYYMLKKLSGRSHEVITGVAVIRINSFERVVFYDSTKVFFKELTDDEIYSYISSGEGWDKAGAYAVQGMGSELIDKLDGDYYNVMGLPFDKLKLVLKGRFNVEL
ncbi:MAG: Maf-like protein, partial [Clostridiales bacterium]|nr:Maf-like protein [Clostridiales bacterium]